VRFNDVAQWERWTWSTGQRRMWEAVPIEDRPAVRALAAERLDACRDAQGHISFDQGVRYNPRDTLSSRGRTKITPIRVRSLGDAASAPISWWRPAPTTPARTDESVPARPNHWRATRTQMRVHRSCRA